MVDHPDRDAERPALRRVNMPPEVERWVREVLGGVSGNTHVVLQSSAEREAVCVLVPRHGYDLMDSLAHLARHPDRLQALLQYRPEETFSYEQVFESTRF